MIPLHVSGFQTGLVLGRGVGGGGEVGSRFPLPLPIGQCPPEKKETVITRTTLVTWMC